MEVSIRRLTPPPVVPLLIHPPLPLPSSPFLSPPLFLSPWSNSAAAQIWARDDRWSWRQRMTLAEPWGERREREGRGPVRGSTFAHNVPPLTTLYSLPSSLSPSHPLPLHLSHTHSLSLSLPLSHHLHRVAELAAALGARHPLPCLSSSPSPLTHTLPLPLSPSAPSRRTCCGPQSTPAPAPRQT